MSRTALLACVALIGGTLGAQSARLYPVPESDQRITIDLPTLSGAAETHVQHSGFWHREDYARFSTDQAQAEIIYAAADPFENAALDTSLTFDRARDSFSVNAQGTLSLGAVGRFSQPDRTVFYQPYALQNLGWACVALKSEWNPVARDPSHRPARVMFGYVCDKSGGAMTMERAKAMASSISTKGSDVSWQGHGPRLSQGSIAGNGRFPFGFGSHFNDTGGDGYDG